MQNKNHQKHKPVLLEQVVEVLDPKIGESYLDCTAGYGGHAQAIIDYLGSNPETVLVDRDGEAIAALAHKFGSTRLIQKNYLEAAKELQQEGQSFDLILLDLGVSSPQIDNPDRGFSFKNDGPLDMRMDKSQELSASVVVNRYTEHELARIFHEYGEERKSRAIAAAIVANRPITSTSQLAGIIRGIVGRSGDIDPATRCFQGLRIEVNSELISLAQALPILVQILKPGGRMAVISFHSLEDRIVKQFFEKESKNCICPPKQPICTCNHVASLAKLDKKPLLGSLLDVHNPRARSASLRAAVKLKPKPKEDA